MSATRLSDLPIIDERGLRALVPHTAGVLALESALRDGSADAFGAVRQGLQVPNGWLEVVAATSDRYVGAHLSSHAPGNVNVGQPTVQGVYALFDALTLTPRALVDSAALTAWRSPLVSAMVVLHVTRHMPLNVVVIGTGERAQGHLEAISAIRQIARLTVAGRDRARAQRFAQWAVNRGHAVQVVAGSDLPDGLREPIHDAEVVICATDSAHPVFSSSWLMTPSLVLATGGGDPNRREVDSELVLGGTLIVESRATALTRAGEVLIPLNEGLIGPEVIDLDLTQLIRDHHHVSEDRPVVLSNIGEPWEDLCLASAAYDELVATANASGDKR